MCLVLVVAFFKEFTCEILSNVFGISIDLISFERKIVNLVKIRVWPQEAATCKPQIAKNTLVF